jgi:DNA-3-methyladenine glycosylase
LSKLPRGFYTRGGAMDVARSLLGKRLVVPAATGERVSGRVVEVEAYVGTGDRASHAYGGRRTQRTETMYAPGGVAYVYFVYGMHHQFNVVTGPEGTPAAVLVRAVEPLEGVELMRRRRPVLKDRELTNGPGKLCRSFGIDRTYNGADLDGPLVWLEDDGFRVSPSAIASGPRVGVAYAGEDALLPYRLWIKENPFVSPAGHAKPARVKLKPKR